MNEKQTVDTEYALEIAQNRIDSLIEQNKKLEAMFIDLKQDYQSLSDESKAHWKAEKELTSMLNRIAAVLAIDTIIDKTHRERNITNRMLVRGILQRLKAENQDKDDIPF